MPTHLPRAAPGNFLQVLGEAERKAGGSLHHHRPQHPTRARAAQASVCPSVRPPPAAPGAGRRGGLTLGPSFGTAGPSLPAARAPRRPPAVRSAAIPSPGPPSRRSPAASSEPGRGRASPSGAARQPFPGCPRRAERSERGWDRRQRDPPSLGTAVATARTSRGAPGPNLPRLGCSQVHCLPGPPAPRGVRLRAGSAGPDSLRPAPAAAAAGARRESRGAPEPRARDQTPAAPRRPHPRARHPTCT